MRLSYVFFAALLSCSLAQDSTTTDFLTTTTATATDSSGTDSGTTSSTSSQAFTTTIAVGRAGHTFEPDIVQVPVGGFVEFDFYPTNHSVIRAEYEFPCVPYELTGIGKVGFYSGPQPVDAILSEPPKWILQVNDSDPIFFYCGAPNSCIGYQMVGVINPNASVSIEVQKEYAGNSSFMLLPGQNWPDEGGSATTSTSTAILTTSVTSTATPTSATAGPATTTATAAPTESHNKSSLSAGAIAGIAIGAAAVVLAGAGLFFFFGRRSRRRGEAQPTAPHQPLMGPTNHPPAYGPPGNNFGYMSPSQKHMSVTSAPATDAFGNPMQHSGYGYPSTYPQGYAPPPMQQVQMGQGQPQPSPSTDIFGAGTPTPQQMQETHRSEDHSLRASSPSSMQAAVPGSTVGGIEAFLQRHGRMSPEPENNQTLQYPPQMGPGPYEMSTSGTHARRM